MYAVIASGGKQYKISEGQTIKLEKLPVAPGETVKFDKIILVADGDDIQIGTPYLSGVKISAEVISQGRGEKIRILKFRRRKHHMKQMGHRQDYTEVKISEIDTGKPRSKKAEAAKEAAPAKKKTTAKKPAAKKATKAKKEE